MNKKLVEDLVKVANNLDTMGLSKEASSLDKIARKIVAETDTIWEDYTKDIRLYKKYFIEGQKQEATNVFNAVMKSGKYSNEQKDAFRKQAEGIRKLNYGNHNDAEFNDKLNNLLEASPFDVHIDGTLFSSTNVQQFTDYWISKIQPQFDMTDDYVKKWLSNKFLLYKKSALELKKRRKEQEDSKKSWWQRTFGG